MTAVEPLPVPETLDAALDPLWLSLALSRRFPGATVVSVEAGPLVDRVSTNARFRIDNPAGLPEGLAENLCVKGYFSEAGASYRSLGEIEAVFYRDIAGTTGVRTLRCLYADVDAESRHGVIITEDVVAQGHTFLDPTSGYSVDQVAQSLEQLATLHASTWLRADLADVKVLQPRLSWYTMARGVPEITENFASDVGAGVPTSVADPERIVEAHRRLAADAATVAPWSVIHGDADVGNLFVDHAGRPSLLDWQLVQRGPWYLDVGYHIASTLPVEDRRKHEVDLLHHYLESLAAHGAPASAWEGAWIDIRRGMLHGYYLWAITQRVDPPVTAELVRRLATAVDDHDAFATVGL